MIKRTITYRRALSALAITCSLGLGATLTAQPAAAQTANKLNCKGCVKSQQIRNNGIKSADIKNGQVKNADLANGAVDGRKIADGSVDNEDLAARSVDSGSVANESLRADDLKDEPGVSFQNFSGTFEGEPQKLDITESWAVMKVISLSAPAPGVVTCIAAGYADSDVANKRLVIRAGWDTVGGTTIPVSSNVAIGDSGPNENLTLPMTAMHSFVVDAGSTDFHLKARCQGCLAGEFQYGFHSGACTYVPTVY